jgi:hypothetical protein
VLAAEDGKRVEYLRSLQQFPKLEGSAKSKAYFVAPAIFYFFGRFFWSVEKNLKVQWLDLYLYFPKDSTVWHNRGFKNAVLCRCGWLCRWLDGYDLEDDEIKIHIHYKVSKLMFTKPA